MPKNKNQCCNIFLEYLYLIWDGMVFFGHDDNKLERLRGVKPRWYDRFKNRRWLIFNVTFVSVSAYILSFEFNLIGQVKSQQLNTKEFTEKVINVKETLGVYQVIGAPCENIIK